MTTQPVLDPRTASEMLDELLSRIPGFVPEWAPAEGDASHALAQVFSRYLAALGERLNRAPEKSRLAFFDQLGISLLSAKAAQAPVVFRPILQLGHARVPARSQVAANVAGRDEPLVFETRQAIALAASRLADVVALWPGRDAYADHTREALGGEPFTLFDGMQPVPHVLYLAHDSHFALSGVVTVELLFELARPGSEPLALAWEYWDGETWRAFKALVEPTTPEPADVFEPGADSPQSVDGTLGLTRSGIVRLAADCSETKKTLVNGIEAYWIRGRLLTPLPPVPGRSLPLVDRISIRTVVKNAGTAFDAAFVDGLELDTGKSFYPFGQQPQPGTAFYLASTELLSREGTAVTLAAEAASTPQEEHGDRDSTPELRAEFWDGGSWQALNLGSPALVSFIDGSSVSFAVPRGLEASKVNGKEGHWLRIRLRSGGYYRSNIIQWTDQGDDGDNGPATNRITVTETIPPAIQSLAWNYTYESPLSPPEACFAFNDFRWADRSDAARFRGNAFEPFTEVEDRVPTVYFGFDRPLPVDSVSMYLDIAEEAGRLRGPLLRWEAFDGREWLGLAADDETANLALPGMVAVAWPGERPRATGEAVIASGTRVQLANAQQAAQFSAGQLLYLGELEKGELVTVTAIEGDTLTLRAPVAKEVQRVPVAVAQLPRFGQPRTWLRARLQSDGDPLQPLVQGVFLNAAWAEQVVTYENEALGASNGEPGQTFFFRQTPVLPGESVEVRELSGKRAAVELPLLQAELTAAGMDVTAIRTVNDPRTGELNEVWVRWESRPNLFFSGPDDRHYVVERSRGLLRFGNNVQGRIPPPGPDNIRAARYVSGGGAIGNVPAGALSQLLSGVPAEGVSNPKPAEGGADGEAIEGAGQRAPHVIRHRMQALSLADYEALAREASPAVAVARALPATHPSGRPAPGWVRIVIQPNSPDPEPQPSFGLRRQVQRYLQARTPAATAAQVAVVGPDYLAVGVEASVVPLDPSAAGVVRDTVGAALAAFLHPVTGGPEGQGWPFGRAVYLSDVAAIVEAAPGLDHVETLQLLLGGTPRGEVVKVPPDRIVVAGQIRISIGRGEA